MLKASQFVRFCKGMVGQAYWYACCVYKCTTSRAKSKAKQWPDHYTADRYDKMKEQIRQKLVCCDCVGLIKGFFWTDGGESVLRYIAGEASDFTNTYRSNGMPDHSANTLFEWCKKQGAKYGKIATIPDVPGVLVFKSGHVGVYVGGGVVVEAKGFDYGVVKSQLNKRPWVAWAYLPSWVLEYDTVAGVSVENATPEAIVPITPSTETTNNTQSTASVGKKSVRAVVIGDRVNIRRAPSLTAKVIRRVNRGDELTVVSVNKQSKWARLSDGAYICTDYIKRI